MSNMRNDWKLKEVLELFDKPFNELLFDAHDTHIKNHKKDMVQVCTLYYQLKQVVAQKTAVIVRKAYIVKNQ